MALPAQPNQSLMHGLSCLQAVVSAQAPLGSREVARLLGLEHTRVNRLLGTLCHLGMLERTANRKYKPGTGIHLLSAQSLRGSGLLATALPLLRPLVKEQVIISLGVLWDQHVCYLVRAVPGQQPEDAIGAHNPHPADRSILGLALLAAMPSAAARRLLSAPPLELGGAALKTLVTEMAQTRAQGFAHRYDPVQRSHAIAVAVGTPAVAAIGLTGIATKRFIPRLVNQLQDLARTVEASLLR